jgi:hypothetical protein
MASRFRGHDNYTKERWDIHRRSEIGFPPIVSILKAASEKSDNAALGPNCVNEGACRAIQAWVKVTLA